jgi:hypothetical protein
MSYLIRVHLAAAFLLSLSGCGASRPVLYPNQHLKTVGSGTADQAISTCMAEADEYISSGGASEQKARNVAKGTAVGGATGAATGAVGGAIAGNAGQGAAVGAATGATAGMLGSVFGVFGDSGPSPTYQRYVERCLQERGYEPIGWE